MKGNLYLAAVSMLVLSLGSPVGVVSYADGWIDPSRIDAGGESWGVGTTHASDLLPAALPFTEYALAQVYVSSAATGAAIATCPSGSVVVGGGYSAHADVAFYTQYKYENGWRGDATNNSGSSKMISVYAACLHNVSGASVTQTHGQVDVPPRRKGQAVAPCPAGSVATGGGFHAYPDGSLRVYNSSKSNSGEGWQSWAENVSGSSKTLHAYAVCLSGSGGTSAPVLEAVSARPNSSAYAYPTCERGRLATAGGFAAQSNLIVFVNAGPYGGHEWRVFASNTHSREGRVLHADVICLSLPGLVSREYLYLPLTLAG